MAINSRQLFNSLLLFFPSKQLLNNNGLYDANVKVSVKGSVLLHTSVYMADKYLCKYKALLEKVAVRSEILHTIFCSHSRNLILYFIQMKEKLFKTYFKIPLKSKYILMLKCV